MDRVRQFQAKERAIDLRGPVASDLQARAVREIWQTGFRAVEISPISNLATVVVAELELDRMGRCPGELPQRPRAGRSPQRRPHLAVQSSDHVGMGR